MTLRIQMEIYIRRVIRRQKIRFQTHTGRFVRLPEHLKNSDLIGVTPNPGHVNLPDQCFPFPAKLLDCHCRGNHLTSLGLRSHLICGVHGDTVNIPVLDDDRTIMTAYADRYRDPLGDKL